MFEAPDRRVWYIGIPTFIVGLVFLVTPPDTILSRAVEPLLYMLCIVLGVSIGVLSLREGHSLLRPSITANDQPFLFWLEVGVGCFTFSAMGAWNLLKVAGNAG